MMLPSNESRLQDEGEENSTLNYDKESKQVTGRRFRIRCVGEKSYQDILAIFLYQDDDVDFYFLAERMRWIEAPSEPTKRKLIDTREYNVIRLWCVDDSCVNIKENISYSIKEAAKKNILSGLMLMEECGSPPNSVRFGR